MHLALQAQVAVHGDLRVLEELAPGLLAEPPPGGFGSGRGEPYVDRCPRVLAARPRVGPRHA